MTARPASTVLVLRPGAEGPEIFLVQRHHRSGFFPNAWVFPGGRVDAGDSIIGNPRVRGGAGALDRMGLDAAAGVAHLVAAARETFEEAGIWLGERPLPAHLRDPLARGEIGLVQALEEHDATLDLDRLHAWSWWVTPEDEPRRYDTRFLVAIAEADHARHDDRETVDSGWFRPADVLAAPARFPLAPPTWWTLHELAVLPTVEAILEAAATLPQDPIQPKVHLDDDGLLMILPGHPLHPCGPLRGMPPCIGFGPDGGWEARAPSVPTR